MSLPNTPEPKRRKAPYTDNGGLDIEIVEGQGDPTHRPIPRERWPWLRQYYERLRAAGKPGKVAIIAAMRKLLTAVWSVATHRRRFVAIMPA